MTRGMVLAVVGAQYGSEGKGVIVHHLANDFAVHVRVGGRQAGHTFYHRGQKFIMRQLPCGWTNPNASLYIGAGAVLDIALLEKEIQVASIATGQDVGLRTFVDNHALIMDQADYGGIEMAQRYGDRIGSTQEGVGAARIARIMRDPSVAKRLCDLPEDREFRFFAGSVSDLIRMALLDGKDVLLEGTQGLGLSLVHGRWPFVTSADTSAAQLAADVGLPPHWVDHTLLVARTFSIRVGGNSGPLMHETDWGEISRRIGRPVEERTTVTHRVRRVGWWDDSLFSNAVKRTDPVAVALTFMDYLEPSVEGATDASHLTEGAKAFIANIEAKHGVKVALVGTGGPECNVVEYGDWRHMGKSLPFGIWVNRWPRGVQLV
jgi:adenylosuccinate synthase